MLTKVTTTNSIDRVGTALEEGAGEFGLSILNSQDLAQRMTDKGFPFETPVRVFDVCSASHAHEVLSKRIDIATAMPCRIALYESAGKTVLATLKPTVLLPMFGEESLAEVAEEVERRITGLMKHAAD